jgi:hypothetical protein
LEGLVNATSVANPYVVTLLLSLFVISAESTPAPEEIPMDKQAPETEKKELSAENVPKKSVFVMMCGCFGGKKAPAIDEKADLTKNDETAKKEEDEEAEKPEGETAEASA